MKLSEGVEWAIHCCTMLADLPEQHALTTANLAEYFNVPKAYLAKQLQSLSNAGLVTAVTGRSGGYRLARDASKVSLRDVVLAIEGVERNFKCQEIRRRGPSGQNAKCYTRPCGIARAMWAAEIVWLNELGKSTLQSLIDSAAHEISREQKVATKAWLKGLSKS